MTVNYKKFNPNGFYLMKYLNVPSIRFIILYGGSSSAKSFSCAQSILVQTLLDKENTLVMRKVGASISKTIYEDFKVAARGLGILSMFTFTQNCIKCENGARIDFSGLDDPEKIKGISNYKRLLLDEWSEFEHADFKQLRKRLRGKKGQQIICTFNPISELHWIKKEFLDLENLRDIPMEVEFCGEKLPLELTKVKSLKMNESKSVINPRTGEIDVHAPDMIVIQSTYLNNFWVIGSPDGTYGYYDEQCIADFERDRQNDPDYYNIYALGEWGILRTGSEFFGSFNRGKHVCKNEYDPTLPIHISVDSNVLPYISIGYWQIDLSDGKRIWQFHETCAGNPDNTVRRASALVADYIHSINYADKLYIHGDASTKASNNIDDEKRSWMDLFIDNLQKKGLDIVDMVGNKNPSVAMTGEFINAIFDGSVNRISIQIDESCVTSIEDYMSVQKDVNGAILKARVKNKTTQQTYEEHGHLSDTMRYVVYDFCKDEYTIFSNRRKRNLYARDGFIHFFNPDNEYSYSDVVMYVMPNVNGKFIMMLGGRVGKRWHIFDIVYKETLSTEEMSNYITTYKSDVCVFESQDAYFTFARELRDNGKNIRILKEYTDVESRISATSDFVRNNILFSSADKNDYSMFLNNMYDYNSDSEQIEASTILSGFVQYVIKSYSDVE